jgi:DNA-binding CsgD family transcriptional regulator
MSFAPLRSPVLVGRVGELYELIERRLEAARGRGACVLLSGDAGMGKSRLISAFRETVRGGRASVGIGVAREFGNAPYGPLREALAAANCALDLSREASREEQLAAVAAGVESACRRRHRVLILEDAQWADEGTLRALLQIASAIGSLRLLLIVTFRADDLPHRNALATLLSRLYRAPETHRIALGPLPDRDVRRLVRLALGDRARLPAGAVAEIVERCEGNPFFAQELLKSALERREPHAGRSLPLTIRAAVTERCAALDEGEREILHRAAVLGRRFDAALLAAICARPKPVVLRALRRLRDLQIVDEISETPARYAFCHELTREAIYDTMLLDEVRPLHRRISQVLEKTGAGAFDLGYHAWAANDGPRALRHNEQAGDEAMNLHAYADARRGYERALCGAQSAAERGRLLGKAADAAARDGKADVAASLYERAAGAFEEAGDETRVADLYVAMSSQARVAGDTIASRTALRRALARFPEKLIAPRAKLSLALAFTYLDRCENRAAAELIEQSGAAETSASYASALNYAAAVRGDLVAVREAAALYLARCNVEGVAAVLQARFNFGFTLCALGVDGEALDVLEDLRPQLAERRLRSLEVLTCANAALLHARGARWDLARAAIERGLAVPEPATTGPMALAAAGLTVGVALADEDLVLRSAPPEAVEMALRSRINSTLGRIAGPYARWRYARGDHDGAAAVLRTAVETLGGAFGATETLIAAVELGDEATRRNALPFLSKLDAMAQQALYAATAADMRAFEARRGGDAQAAAASHAAAAAALYRGLGWPAHEARVRELAGDAASAALVGGPLSASTSRLSAREREVAALVAQGIPNKRLAERLAVSQRTVEKHITSIFAKLGLRNRTELTLLMMRRSP